MRSQRTHVHDGDCISQSYFRCPHVFLAFVLFATFSHCLYGEHRETPPDPDCCGQSSLYLLLRLLDRPAALERIRYVTNPDAKGQLSMLEMRQAAARFDVTLTGRRVPVDELASIQTPFIQLVPSRYENQLGHFRVLRPVSEEVGLQVIDPALPPRIVPMEELVRHGESEVFVLFPIISRQGLGVSGWAWWIGVLLAIFGVWFVVLRARAFRTTDQLRQA